MKKHILFALFYLMTIQVSTAQKSEKRAVKLTIETFFKGFHSNDTALIRSVCTAQPILQSYLVDSEGYLRVHTEQWSNFMNMLATPTKNKMEERFDIQQIAIEKTMASVWVPYTFWLNDKLYHCGTNSFQLVKEKSGWKIQYILDTRRKQGCKS